MPKSLLILISGPYMTGTNGDEKKIAENLRRLEEHSLPIFQKGHLAVVGEWFAWPIIRGAGGTSHSSPEFHEYQYPVAHRLLEACDALFRIPGDSKGADLEIEKAKNLGKTIYYSLDEIPHILD